MQAELVEELWAGLGDNGYHCADGRQWWQRPDQTLSDAQRLLIHLSRQLPPEYSKNVRLIMKGESVAFLYALGSTAQHFWGVQAGVVARLSQQTRPFAQQRDVPWAMVLLDGSWQTGYWFDSATVLKWRSRWRPRQRENGYYVGGNVMKCREDTKASTRVMGTKTLFRLLDELLGLS